MKKSFLVGLAGLALSFHSVQAQTVIHMHGTHAKQGSDLGSIRLDDTQYGLLITPNLAHLPPGLHGFHLHTKPHCGHHGKNAAGHFDPEQTGKHLGPYNAHGHLGDLPALYVAQDGKASLPVLAPRLKEIDFKGHAVIIHEHGDNYSDTPAALGGGGSRIACGILNYHLTESP